MVKWNNTHKVSNSQQSSIMCMVLGHLSCSKLTVCTQLNFYCPIPCLFQETNMLADKTGYAKISAFQAFIAVEVTFY